MNTTSAKRWLVLTTLATALATPIAPNAEAEDLFYDVPMSIAEAEGDKDFYAVTPGQVSNRPYTEAENNGGYAYAQPSDNQFTAVAAGAYPSGGDARAFMGFVVRDPQARGQVLLNVSSKLVDRGFKGVAAATAPAYGFGNLSVVSVRVAPSAGPYMISYDDNGNLTFFEYPLPAQTSYDALRAYAWASCGWDGPEESAVLTCRTQKAVIVQEQVVEYEDGYGPSVTLDAAPTLSVAPNLYYVIGIEAAVNAGGVAVIDPVLEPHPDNPDIVIEFPNAVTNPNPGPPMAGITLDYLVAQGIDPQPFIDLGFLGSSGTPPAPDDTTAPTTQASPTPAANPGGWNKTPVTVTLTATDNAGGSGVKEVHYSLNGAASGSQIVAGNGASVTISAEGTTTLTYFAVDNAGNQETAKTLTVRIDRTPPTVTGLPSNCSLWPPNHWLVQVAAVTASDALSGLAGAPAITATSNEPDSGTGDGDRSQDVVIANGTVQVRAERDGHGTGRVYTITASATDLAGNTTTQTVTCNVPHDASRMAQH